MIRFPKGLQGPSAEDATRRLDDALAGADEASGSAAELAARVEKARTGSLGRERARLLRKHGSGSAEAEGAERALQRQSLVLDAAMAEAQTARLRVPPLAEGSTRVHGRVVDRRRLGVAGVEARLLDAKGRALAKAATDENGYFRLDVKPRAAGRAKTAGRRIVLPAETAAEDASGTAESGAEAAASPAIELVVVRGQQELFRETLRDLPPGQSVYREPVLDKQ